MQRQRRRRHSDLTLIMSRNHLSLQKYGQQPQQPEQFLPSTTTVENVTLWYDFPSDIRQCAGRPILGRRDVFTTADREQLKNNSRSTGGVQKFYCPLCRKNGEQYSVYSSHNLKEDQTVTCPVLRSYQCPTCGATGDKAHTASYCPKRPIGQSVGMLLKNTPHNATGLRKKNSFHGK